MSHSSSDSDSDSDDDIIVRLADIRTIGQLFQSGVLKGVAKPRYAPNPAFLDRISLFQGDITVMEVDSIVNAANRSLLGGGGVDGAIHAAAGRQLLEECSGLGGCDTGESKITAAYKLPSKHIIHTVGPIYSRSDIERRAQQLESCYRTSLNLAVEKSLKHIAFPSISTGIYGYPIEDATHLALDLVRRFCELDVGSKLDRVIFVGGLSVSLSHCHNFVQVVWSNKDKEVYETLIPEYFPPSDAPEELVASDAPSAGPPVERPAEASVLDAPAAASVSEEHKASGEEPNVP